MSKFKSLFLLLSITIAACSDSPPEGIVKVSDDDKAMNAAMQKAKDTSEQFLKAFQNPTDRQNKFSVKKLLKDNESDEFGEHIWIDPISYENGIIKGKLGNDPGKLKKYKYGDPIDVKISELSDWMFIDNGKLMGGYTLRVLVEKMSEEEQIEFKKRAPFKF